MAKKPKQDPIAEALLLDVPPPAAPPEQPDSPPPAPKDDACDEDDGSDAGGAMACLPLFKGQVRNALVWADMAVRAEGEDEAAAIFAGWLTAGLTVKPA